MNDTIVLEKEKEKELILKEENSFNDVKSSLILPAKLSKTVSAFANASGGDIYIGIKEDTRTRIRNIDGADNKEDYNDIVAMLERLEGLNEEYTLTFLVFSNKKIGLQVTIFKNHSIVKTTNGDIYVRKNAQDLKIETEEQKKRLELDKGIYPYENCKVAESDIGDAINSQIYNYFSKNVIPNIDKFNWLRAQKLCVETSLNVVGTLLFTDEPQAVLPKKSSIKIFRYRTSDGPSRATLSGDPITIEGCAYNQIYSAVTKVKEIIEKIKKLDKRFSDIKYPDSTIHEIVTNAVLHRDYSITKDIQIRIFDNRVEVESPGKLAGHITVKNILNEQFARNPKLVRLMNKFPSPPNKDVGEGLNTAFNAMTALRLKPPVILETDSSVLVIIKHEKLASPEEIIMDYIKTHDIVTNSIGREITGISSENTMKRVFYKLRDSGYLEKVDDVNMRGKKSAWRLKGDADISKIIKADGNTQITLFDDGGDNEK